VTNESQFFISQRCAKTKQAAIELPVLISGLD